MYISTDLGLGLKVVMLLYESLSSSGVAPEVGIGDQEHPASLCQPRVHLQREGLGNGFIHGGCSPWIGRVSPQLLGTKTSTVYVIDKLMLMYKQLDIGLLLTAGHSVFMPQMSLAHDYIHTLPYAVAFFDECTKIQQSSGLISYAKMNKCLEFRLHFIFIHSYCYSQRNN